MKKLHPILLLTLFALLLTTTAFGTGLEERVREHTLKNGMKLLMVERHTSPTVAAWIRFRVGSVDERSDERGIAHLLEHMLFKGTKTLGTKNYAAEKPLLDKIEETALPLVAEKAKGDKADQAKVAELQKKLNELEAEAAKYVIKEEFAEIYARNGGTGYNAFTSKDGTTYLINMPANKLELWAAIESDRMQNAVLREFYTERDVVMEERRRSYDTEPGSKLWENFVASSYHAHPFGQPIIGWMSDIENLTRTKAEGFLTRYYKPNNAIVALVGDIDPDKTIALVEKYFSTIPLGTPVPPVAVVEPRQEGERRVEIIADSEPELLIGYHKPSLPAADDYVFDVIDMVLADGRTSRLYKKLVVEKQLVTEVSSFSAPGSRYPNLFVIAATTRAPHTVAEVEAAIYEELERLKKEPITERELKQILNKLEYEESRQMLSNGGLARNLTEYEAVAGTWRYLIEHRSKVARITPDDVIRVARKYFTRENRIVGFITKKTEN
ncbi:insulinase family protein [Geobacter hydrogenophilus]|uniref:Peptidase M16 n=1 Tax=Geobacter hydrogenophilus TaxID=40983 RepID=A0A9W6LDM7_9BACT|nr:pitrilysin family protein [Geobacter hydrogenophilus]MBT0892473.1 insulinase family protein [Geobacter hydrogenophilus]GLI39868.1 peptidase M16 [Geobacter hydrogenophilus]